VSVRVGIGLGSFAPEEMSPDSFFPLVDRLDEFGYDSIWISDSATLGGPAPLVTLGAVAVRSKRLKLGTNVLVGPARNPVLLAKELSTLDSLSQGRLLPAFGLGVEIGPEAAAIGTPRGERGPRTEEAIEVIRLLWRGEPVTYDGRFTKLEQVTLSPPPIRPGLDIWLGGSRPAALRRSGRLADGWIGSFLSPAEVADAIGLIKEAAAEAGREIEDDHYGTTLFAAPSADELPPAAERLLTLRPELAREDHIAFGAAELRALLERFVAAGASKFVVVPIAADRLRWLEQLRVEAVEPVER
jgi:probable F420-dependent oxidoreductase